MAKPQDEPRFGRLTVPPNTREMLSATYQASDLTEEQVGALLRELAVEPTELPSVTWNTSDAGSHREVAYRID